MSLHIVACADWAVFANQNHPWTAPNQQHDYQRDEASEDGVRRPPLYFLNVRVTVTNQ
jgi:hypothetical protein